ncbi:hypothetical protein Tco_0980154 [Tanacetum coccineum]
MATLKFADTHNMVAFLAKPTESEGFEQIVDFPNAHPIRYALMVNPTIYVSCIEQFWSTAKAKTINGKVQIHTLVDGKKIIITESFVRRDLRLADEEGVDYQVVYKERGDRLVRAATTASSLEIELDSGNIDKTHSKATPNESSSPGTTSRGGLRGNILQSDEDRIKLNELMELCTNLQTRVLDLEKTKTSQGGILDNEQSLGKDASKQGRKIDDIDVDEEITLVNVQDDVEMFDVNDLHGEEVFFDQEVPVKEVSTAGEVSTVNDIQAKIDADHQLAEQLQAQEQEELTDVEKATLFVQLLEKRRKHFAAKRVEEKRNKPPTRAQQRKIMCTYLKNMEGKNLKDLKDKSFDSIQKMFNRAFKWVNTFVDFRTELVEGSSKRAGEKLTQESTKK